MEKSTQVPTFDALMNPLVQALKSLGGSGTIEEIYNKVVEIAGLTEKQLKITHLGINHYTEVEYRLAWSRTYLRKYGLIESSTRGIWALTPAGRKIDEIDEKEVLRVVRAQFKKAPKKDKVEIPELEETTNEQSWREDLLSTLMEMSPDAFERLAQRILRESGFTQVEVTGRSGDNGIDGKGIMRLGGLLSFHVIFQCKRYRSAVSSPVVRDFRGAMVGRADKGLLITTGTFTNDAMKEATRDGAPPIDLVNGDQLLDLLKNLGLGVKSQIVQKEEVTIDREWLLNI